MLVLFGNMDLINFVQLSPLGLFYFSLGLSGSKEPRTTIVGPFKKKNKKHTGKKKYRELYISHTATPHEIRTAPFIFLDKTFYWYQKT